MHLGTFDAIFLSFFHPHRLFYSSLAKDIKVQLNLSLYSYDLLVFILTTWFNVPTYFHDFMQNSLRNKIYFIQCCLWMRYFWLCFLLVLRNYPRNLLWIIVFPLCFYIVLKKHENKLQRIDMLKKYGFLYFGKKNI